MTVTERRNHYEIYGQYRPLARRLLAQNNNNLLRTIQEAVSLGQGTLEAECVCEFIKADSMKPWHEAAASASFHELYDLMRAMIPVQQAESSAVVSAITSWCLNRLDAAGRRVYQVSPGLAQRLLLTELRGLCCEDLQLPYEAIYVEVDESLGFVLHDPHTGCHVIRGVYVVKDLDSWCVLFYGAPNENSTAYYDDSVLYFWLPLADGTKPVLDAVAHALRNSSIAETVMPPFQWLMNLIIYITRPGFDDVEHIELNTEAQALWRRMQNAPAGKKRDRIRERWRASPKQPCIYVGRSIPLNHDLPRSNDAKNTVTVRTLVAGHYQRYHVGPNRSETVWKFREPYWRGEGLEEPKPHFVR